MLFRIREMGWSFTKNADFGTTAEFPQKK